MERAEVMNNTKWDELRLAMYGLGELTPAWRTRDIKTGYISSWDREWFYHFRNDGYDWIEWVEIQLTSPEQEAAVLAALVPIHVPGEKIEHGVRVYGHVPIGKAVNYFRAL
jgi:hypothetical protein